MEKRTLDLTRRRWLQGAGAAAALAATAPRSPVHAQGGGKIVLGTWGGDYSKLLGKNIDAPLLAPKGLQVEHAIGGDPERRAKMRAEARLPRGTTDLQALSAAQMFEMQEAGLVLPVDYGRIPNAKNLLPEMKYLYGIGHIYSGKVLLYNPKLTKAPTSFADTLDPKHGPKLGIIDIQYQFTLMAAALASGGSMSNYEPGKERLLACRKAGAKIYPTNEALAAGLKNEEIALCIMWKARAVQWQNAGITVETVAPAEGVPLYVSGFVIPKNAPNKDGAYIWLNAMLEPSAQVAFAEDMGYNPTVTNAKVPDKTQKRIGFTAEEQKRLKDLDYAYLAQHDAALKEWWDKVFKG
ncbi:MAG TPA: extracellular solute-binding protein [Methylomirabilota bacterium]|jgi:putative spermidine/putrescine transport system substrate-binding protein|nr:extracellular solute-binding protein [Methylomirabilota bacterium]